MSVVKEKKQTSEIHVLLYFTQVIKDIISELLNVKRITIRLIGQVCIHIKGMWQSFFISLSVLTQ